jgi:ATP-dependent helicase HrpB
MSSSPLAPRSKKNNRARPGVSARGPSAPDFSTCDLPVRDCLPALLDALRAGSNAILVAPPGAGKTTLAPLALLDAPWRQGGRIIMLEPRRLAARAAAWRMASLIGENAGQTVGFRTRLDSAVSSATVIEVITEGLLVRRLHGDPGLHGVAAVIFDEIHERSLDADLALAFCLDLQRGLRPELRLLAMSATADAARLATLLDAPVIESAGRMYPVSVRHAARDIAGPRDLPESMARAIRAALAEHDGDILAFLPGMGEIARTEAALSGAPALVLRLHGDLPPAEQDRALRRAEGQRRVVLSSSIAETSLTVPGVRVVVDGGWRRAPVLDAGSGLTRLQTLRVSRATADQRAGRAGREAPGTAIRLWTEAQQRGLAPFDKPEILDAELSHLALDCAAWGAAPADLPFQLAPPAGALAAGQALLAELGALDGAGRISHLGRRMVQLGAHPRLAAMMLAAATPAAAALAADLAALLEERDPLRGAGADISLRLAALHGHQAAADRGTVARIRQAAQHYRRRLNTGAAPHGDAGMLLAAAFPDRIALSRGDGAFRLSGGGGARLAADDSLAKSRLLVAAGLELKTSQRITLAAPLDPDRLPPCIAARCTEQVESGYDAATGAVFSRRRRRFGALVLEDRMVPADPAEVAATLARVLVDKPDRLPWTDEARQFRARAALLRGVDGAFPDLADAALAADQGAWLAPYLNGIARLGDARKLDLLAALRARLTWQEAAWLDRDVPTHIALPGGRAAVDYTGPVPVAAARAQAFYGLKTTPRLAGGKIPLQVALLSPAGRPAAITGDLESFWRGAWADMRREMRGRYPKHAWPEDPTAPA